MVIKDRMMSEADKNRQADMAERLGDLAEKYMKGTLDEIGEKELRDMLLSFPEYGIPEKYEALAVLFRGFDAMSQEKMPKRSKWRKKLVVSVSAAAVAAAAVVLFFAARPVYGYDSSGRPITDRKKAMTQTECFQMLSRLEISVKSAEELAFFLDSCNDGECASPEGN